MKETLLRSQDLQKTKTRECVYCRSKNHKLTACSRIQNVNERKIIIFSIGEGHTARNCRSQISYLKCKRHHHTSVYMDATNQQ